MDYMNFFTEKNILKNSEYPHNDIGTAKLFYDLNSSQICYVNEAKSWYAYDGRRWVKDDGGFKAMELCKSFVQAFGDYVSKHNPEDEDFVKYTEKLTSRRHRDGILRDAMSIAPKNLSQFDTNKLLINLQNGTFNLHNFSLQPHNAADMITKLAPVKYIPKARCKRWDKFINEITCGDDKLAVYLQKALGYALTGLNEYEVFFIFYGEKTRNGKSTLLETISNLLGDYARNVQAQSLAKRSSDGASASPDMARLKGARLVTVPEPEKGLELNIALIKQLTGGDTYTARYLHANPFEFKPEFKIFINTNHLPYTADETVFTSGRVKIIPFDRHFSDKEQDKGLKQYFCRRENKSAVLNWLVEGYRLLLRDGFDAPTRVDDAVEKYRSEADIIGLFLAECTTADENGRVPTSELYACYTAWIKDNCFRPLSNRSFTMDIRRRCEVRRTGAEGRVVIGVALKNVGVA